MIIIRKVKNVYSVSPAACQGQGDTRLTLTPSFISNYNYVIMVSDWKSLKYFWAFFFYCNHQVHTNFLIILYLKIQFPNSQQTQSCLIALTSWLMPSTEGKIRPVRMAWNIPMHTVAKTQIIWCHLCTGIHTSLRPFRRDAGDAPIGVVPT
jgi:hypothetical protein